METALAALNGLTTSELEELRIHLQRRIFELRLDEFVRGASDTVELVIDGETLYVYTGTPDVHLITTMWGRSPMSELRVNSSRGYYGVGRLLDSESHLLIGRLGLNPEQTAIWVKFISGSVNGEI